MVKLNKTLQATLFLAFLWVCMVTSSQTAYGSGFGVFTQGASGLGQANAVVAHPSGPASLYFNPALLNDVPGRQIEFGTTGVYADRSVKYDSGGQESVVDAWNFPSTFYYTEQVSDKVSAGFGLFFPFGLSTEWDENYAGRYLGTYGDIVTLNINPVLSCRVNSRLSLAGGFSVVYLDATLKKKINQTAAYTLTDLLLSGGAGGVLPPLAGTLTDISQNFVGEGWGSGYNLGMLFKATDRISIGATYRSHIDIAVHGKAEFSNVDPTLALFFPETSGAADIRLPAQATAAVAVALFDSLTVEAGVRWEDWSSTSELKVDLERPVLGQSADVIPRDWSSTWTYNIGAQFQLSEPLALNAGYLFGENAVPASTFEPLIPDSDAHLFTLGIDWTSGAWTLSGAFGYEVHEDRDKTNALGDPLGGMLAGMPVATANGTYESDIYLLGFSVGYRF